jgi:hypothetical protein
MKNRFYVVIALAILVGSLIISARSLSIQPPPLPNYVVLRCDFHVHSNYSSEPGELSPTLVIDLYKQNGYDCIALTDHNNVSGWVEAQAEADKQGMIFVPGEEVTCNWYWNSNTDSMQKHVGALFINRYIDYKPFTSNSTYPLNEIVEPLFQAIHQAGGIGIVNHPRQASPGNCSWPEWSKFNTTYYTTYVIDGWEYNADNKSDPQPYQNWLLNSGCLYLEDHDFHTMAAVNNNLTSYYTLVLATSRTVQGVRDALAAHRTIVYIGGIYYGSPEMLALFVQIEGLTHIKI